MPYIKQDIRDKIKGGYSEVEPGVLNFLLTQTILSYINIKGRCYNTFNDVLGVLSAIDFEIKRRMLGPYEDKKIEENGDIDGFK